MQATKGYNLIAAALLSCWLPAGSASGAESAWNCTSNAPPLQVEVRHEGGPGLSAANRVYVTAGTNKFAFQLPVGFRLETGDPQKITLVSADYNSLLTWRILGPVPSATPESASATYRELLMERHPGGKIIEEFTRPAVGRRGPAFDVRWSASTGGPRDERIVFIPALAGVMEFSLVSSPEKFKAAQPELDLLLLSFRASDAKGKLVVPLLSDKL
jgi:hypothetical protein